MTTLIVKDIDGNLITRLQNNSLLDIALLYNLIYSREERAGHKLSYIEL